MGSESIEQGIAVPLEQRLNVFALVIYIPGPLGPFLDDLRRELVPGCNPHAHVSLLPPRPLTVDWRVASSELRTVTDGCRPFEIELTGIDIFPVTNVIYIEIGEGAAELRRMHAAMNSRALEFRDPFPYHPHITLGQDLPPEKVARTCERARRLWSEYPGPRRFPAEHAVFVQNSQGNCWIDLADYRLGGETPKS